MLYADISQFPSYDSCQRTAGGLFNIAEHEPLRIAFVARAERGHDGNTALLCCANEVNLAGNEIYRIDDKIIIGKKIVAVLCVIVTAQGIEAYLVVYIKQTVSNDLCLALADGGFQRTQLAVYVAATDGVAVDEREPADAASCERLGTPRADTSQTEYGDMTAL